MRLAPLLKLELRHLIGRALTWAVLAILAVAMLAGSAVGVQRVRDQQATVDRVLAESGRAVAAAKAATQRYAQPSDLVIPVFRDPTDAYSYMYNFLTAYAIKPPAPLTALAAGQSDLQPTHIRINMQSVFPDTAYELRSPRILALGAFDLGFVLVYLLPLAIIALGGAMLVREQDSGTLRMIAAQPIAPRIVAAAKFGALAFVTAPVVVAAAMLALAVTGAIGNGAGLASLVGLGAAIALYVLFWVALCALIASFWRGAVQSLALLVLAWAAMTVVIPAIGSLLLSALWPAPSRIAYVDTSRALADRVPDQYRWDVGAARWLAARPDLAPFPATAVESAEVGRMAHDAYFRAELAPQRDALDAHARRIVGASDLVRLLSPASMFDGGLQKLAATDPGSQLAFTRAADAYSQSLRRHFEPLIVANIGRERPCATCPGRLNFAAHDAIPAFPVDRDGAPGVRQGALVALYLLLVTLIAGGWSARRFRHWPV